MCSGSGFISGNPISVTKMSKSENIDELGIPAVVFKFNYSVPDGLIEDPAKKQEMIDAKIKHLQENNKVFWGDLPDYISELSNVFEDVWTFIGTKFPGFNNAQVDWDEFYNEYDKKILKVKNYGEYAHIITKMGYVLQEGHSMVAPGRLFNKSEDRRDIPSGTANVFRDKAPVFTLGNTGKIGACYTVTYEEEMIVTKVWSDSPNPYKLRIGDEILGFNGVLWKDWIDPLINAGLPYYGSAGAAKTTVRYNLMRSAMANTNLFEKINIKRYDTGAIETLPVVYLDPTNDPTRSAVVTCTELTETEGLYYVDEPNKPVSWKDDPDFTYGIIKDENIGYMYIKECPSGFDEVIGKKWDPYETEFANIFEKAVLNLMNTKGIIIDLRYNNGGREEPFYKGLAHLIKGTEDKLIFKEAMVDIRKEEFTAEDRKHLVDVSEVTGEDFNFPLKADKPDKSYSNPIIVMTGPDCISACDMLVACLSKFPEFTIIGRDTNSSGAGVLEEKRWLYNENDYVFQYIPSETFYFTDEPHKYLIGVTGFIDIPVWFEKETIPQGIDSMRKFAIDLIKKGK